MTLAEYIKIEASDALKATKLQAMRKLLSERQVNGQLLTWAEIEQLANQYQLRQPVFDLLLYPVLEQEITQGSVPAIKLMLRLINYLYKSQNPVIRTAYDVGGLLEIGLQLAPDDIKLMNTRYQNQKRYYEYTIHEVPWGVLYDMNGATAAQCGELVESLGEFERLGQRLQLDDSALVDECRYYYQSYAAYLRNRTEYADFAAYLVRHVR